MSGLKHVVWTSTRAYEKKYAYSLGDGKPLPDELNTNEAKKFIDKIADYGVEHFFICGAEASGEPLMRKDFSELIQYVADSGIEPYVKISGWLMNKNMAEKLAKYNCKMIVTIAGLKEVDDFLRGEGANETSMRAAKLCAQEGNLFTISVVNTKYVVDQIPELVKLSMDIGSHGFSLASLIPQPIGIEEQLEKLGPLEPTPAQREKQLNIIYDLSKEVGNELKLLPYEMFYNRLLKQKDPSIELSSRCSVCHNLESNEWLEVLDNGKAYGCSTLDLLFGDVKTDSFEEIMNRIRNDDTVKKLADAKNIEGKCGYCEFNPICGGCRARAYIFSGNMFSYDPACPYIPRKK